MAELLGRDNPRARVHCLHDNRIDREGMFAEHRVQARRQVGPSDQLENIVGAVAQGHLVDLYAALLRQLGLELEAVTVWIARQLGQFALDGSAGLGTCAQRVLVAGQLDDTGWIHVQLSGQLVHRLAGNVRGQLLNTGLGQGKEIGHAC
jgi:hypothetical protein